MRWGCRFAHRTASCKAVVILTEYQIPGDRRGRGPSPPQPPTKYASNMQNMQRYAKSPKKGQNVQNISCMFLCGPTWGGRGPRATGPYPYLSLSPRSPYSSLVVHGGSRLMAGGKGRGSGSVESIIRVGSGSMRRECGKNIMKFSSTKISD